MKRMSILMSIVLLISFNKNFVLAQNQQWNRVNLDDSATVEFPSQVSRQDIEGKQAISFQGEDAIYLVVIQKGNSSFSDEGLNKFYDGVIKGTLEGAGGGQVIEKDTFYVDGFMGVEVQYTTLNKPNLPAVKYTRFILANGTFYTVNFWTSNEPNQAVTTNRNKFFSSFKTGVRKVASPEPEISTGVYKMGKFMGSLFFYGVLVAAIVAVFRRLRKPKSQL